MLTFLRQSERVYEKEYYRDFILRSDPNGGLSFPSDKDGNPVMEKENTAAWDNYKYALEHPEKYIDKGAVEREYSYRRPALVKDDCGEEFELFDQHGGACQCPRCGNWYNLSGQALKPPSEWGDEFVDYQGELDDLGR